MKLMRIKMTICLPMLDGETNDQAVDRLIKENYCDWCDHTDLCPSCETRDCIATIEQQVPAVNAAPVVHGRWITNKYGETVCSECDNNALQVLTGCLVNRHFEPYKSKFCPNCGAKMDGERRDEDALSGR